MEDCATIHLEMKRVDEIECAKQVLSDEAEAIKAATRWIDASFSSAIDLIFRCKGRIVVTGMGKAGIIAQKISSTLSSIGTASFFLHPAEAMHGDLGRVTRYDVVLVLSNSGETEEVKRLLHPVRKIGAKVISITGRKNSTLAKASDIVLNMGPIKEACPLGLAPTTSTTVMLALGDALALAVLQRRGLRKEEYAVEYARYHPGGTLRRKLMDVEELMRTGRTNPTVRPNTKVKDALLAITEARAGAVTVIDARGRLAGIFTDGDLRRQLASNPDLMETSVRRVMTRQPLTIKKGRPAAEALRILKENKIDELPVVDQHNKVVGLIDVQDLLAAGLV